MYIRINIPIKTFAVYAFDARANLIKKEDNGKNNNVTVILCV